MISLSLSLFSKIKYVFSIFLKYYNIFFKFLIDIISLLKSQYIYLKFHFQQIVQYEVLNFIFIKYFTTKLCFLLFFVFIYFLKVNLILRRKAFYIFNIFIYVHLNDIVLLYNINCFFILIKASFLFLNLTQVFL